MSCRISTRNKSRPELIRELPREDLPEALRVRFWDMEELGTTEDRHICWQSEGPEEESSGGTWIELEKARGAEAQRARE